MQDTRIGRFFAVDPITKKYPELTPYQFASNNPIWMREIEGLEGLPTTKTAFVYYVGPDGFDFFGFDGHTGAGVYNPDDLNGTTYYGPFSGHDGETELRKYDWGDVVAFSEGNTIKYYLNDGYIVQRIHYVFSDAATDMLEGAIDNNARNKYDGDGVWCTGQVNNALYDAFKEDGFSDEKAREKANKIIYYSMPEELTKDEVLETGAIRFDKFYKKDDKYFHEKNIFNQDKDEWQTETTEITDFTKYFSTEEDN